MNSYKLKFFIISFVLAGPVSWGAEPPVKSPSLPAAALDPILGTENYLEKNFVIKIRSYDPASRSYTVYSVKYPAEGDSTVSPEAMVIAIPSLKLATLQKKPASFVGKEYLLKNRLTILLPAEIEMRRTSALKKTIPKK